MLIYYMANYTKCPICKSIKSYKIWNEQIRDGKSKGKYIWTRQKKKILKCYNCDVGFLQKRSNQLEDNKIFRKLYDGDNSIKKFHSFNKPREIRKVKEILKVYNISNKSILESNCGAAVILDYLKNTNKLTCGLDSEIYKNFVEKKHKFFSNLNELLKSRIKFDVILSLSEIEHKLNPIDFVKTLKSKLTARGVLIFRIPNYDNIYRYFMGNEFLMYDFRSSHNFYFSQKSADFLFNKLGLKVIIKKGINEYPINHFIEYLKICKRVNKRYKQVLKKSVDLKIKKNIEKNFLSTSMIYIVRKKT